MKPLSFLIFMIFMTTSALSQNGTKTLRLQLETGQSSFSPSTLMDYMESIELRLHYFGFEPIQVKVYDRKNKIFVEVNEVEDPVMTTDLIAGTGDFKVLPVYKIDDGGKMDQLFSTLQRLTQSQNGEGILSMNTTTLPGYSFRRYPPAVIGMAKGTDIAKVNQVLVKSEIRQLLPPNAKFIWAQKASTLHEGQYDLYLANMTPGQGLEGDHVAKTNVYQEENRFSRVRDIIDIWFDEAGTVELDKISKANVKRELIIVLNNAVISAPIVEGPIETGNIQIEGPFEGLETTALSRILRMKSLPGPPKVVNTVVE
ncbi:MAG: hypothetical protein AAF502_25220 [Bacteroidota bacterium]